jgi:hypothetical protein
LNRLHAIVSNTLLVARASADDRCCRHNDAVGSYRTRRSAATYSTAACVIHRDCAGCLHSVEVVRWRFPRYAKLPSASWGNASLLHRTTVGCCVLCYPNNENNDIAPDQTRLNKSALLVRALLTTGLLYRFTQLSLC